MRTFTRRTFGSTVALGAAAGAALVFGVEANGTAEAANRLSTIASAPFDVAGWTDYARCLRAHGVDAKDPEPAPEANTRFARMADGSELPVTDPAFGACRSREGKGNNTSLYVSPQDMAKHNAFSVCVREHGLPEYPDMDPVTGQWPAGVPFAEKSKAFPAAAKACAGLSPQAPAGG